MCAQATRPPARCGRGRKGAVRGAAPNDQAGDKLAQVGPVSGGGQSWAGRPASAISTALRVNASDSPASSAAAASVALLREPVAGRRGCPTGPLLNGRAYAPIPAASAKCHPPRCLLCPTGFVRGNLYIMKNIINQFNNTGTTEAGFERNLSRHIPSKYPCRCSPA